MERTVGNNRLIDGDKLSILPSADLTGQATKRLAVKSDETGIEYVLPGTDTSLGDLDDVTIDTPTTGEVIVYNTGTGQWENGTVAGLGDMTKAVYDPTNVNADAFDRANHTGTQNTGTIIPENTIGIPTHMTDLSKMLSHMWSATITDGGALTQPGVPDGTINIADGELTIRATDSGHQPLYVGPFTGGTGITLTDNATNYVYVDYNAGNPIVAVTLDPTIINITTKVPMYVVVREGTNISYLDVLDDGIDFIAKTRQRWFYTEKFSRVDSGSVVSESGTRNLACTAGSFYFGNNVLSVDAIDTSVTGTFEYYRKITGAWVETNETQLDNLQYNDISTPGSEALVTLSNSKYAVHPVYAIINNPSHYAVVYSQAEYNTLAEAEASTLPSTLPPSIEGIGQLLGRYIIQKSATTGLMESSFTTVFSAAQATIHNGLSGLQGGTTDEYYHLTSAQHTIATQAATNSLSGYLTPTAQSIGGTKTFNSALNENKGNDIASATTTDIGAATGNFVDITGTTTITGFGTVQAGTRRVLQFDGILTLTHNATSLILPTGANITTAAGDTCEMISLGSGNWRCTNYQRKSGEALVGSAGSKELRITIPGEQIADTAIHQGFFWYNDTGATVTISNVAFTVAKAAAGTGASAAYNIYKSSGTAADGIDTSAVNLFTSAVDLGTGYTSLTNVPNTTTVENGRYISARCTASAGATNKASEAQIIITYS